MTISNIQLYDLLAEQLGKEKARNLVTFVESKVEEGLHEKTSLFATKEDISIIRQDMAKIETKIAEGKTDTIKWVFGFFVALMLAIVGLYFKG